MASPPFELAIDGVADPLRAHGLRGKEAISRLWSFDVVTSGASAEEIERVGLGQRATLVLRPGGRSERAFYGVVSAVQLDEVHPSDRETKYVISIVPRLWLLRRKKKSRVFQAMRVPEIVSAVLQEAGIATRWALIRGYPVREYCTQYEETDYEFVRRILAEAGIYYYFYGGGRVDAAALAANAAIAGAAAVGRDVAAAAGLDGAAPLLDAAALAAATLVPGDSFVGADDPIAYPSVAGDDAAALAAATAATFAAFALTEAAGASAVGSAVVGGVSAIGSAIVSSLPSSGGADMHYTPNQSFGTAYDRVARFALKNTVRSTGAMFRDYDPDRPNVRMQSAAVSTAPFPPSPFEIAAAAAAAAENAMSAVAAVAPETAGAMGVASDVVAGAAGAVGDLAEAAGQRVPLEIYEHHGSFLFPKWSLASDAAPLILRQDRRRASIAAGEGGCHDFSPAHRFELHGHPAPQANGGYVVTSVVHHGSIAGSIAGAGQSTPREREDHRVYFNTFECAPASMPYPPKRPKRRSIQVALTAVVVGPPGDDIHVDKMGRVKVQFHWDRDGKYDGRSSCWIRTMQAWGGTAWGHQFIPRVGMEVAIAFEGGDPDKPMVLGSFYNATHPPSFPLPVEKTRSGIRTQSSPLGNGYNELSFEDRRGQEEVYLHAQKDLREEILNDRTTTVARTQSTSIKKDLIEQVAGDHHSHVRGIHYDFVKNNRLSSVTGAYSVAVRGEMSIVVGTKDKPKAGELFTHGDTIVGGSKSVVLRSDNRIRLEVGESSIEIGPKEIRLTSDKLVLDGQSSTLLKGKGPAMKLGDEAELVAKSIKFVSEKGSMTLNKEVTVDAPKIFLNCPGVAKLADEGKAPKTKKLKLRLSDEAFKPLAGKEYILAAAGAKFEGTTGGDGELELDIPEETQTVTLVVFEERPEGRQYKFRIQVADVPPTDDVPGIKARLQNLGYYWGEVDDVFDDWTRAALREFQSDHGIEVTGDIDGPTKQKLQDLAKV